MLPIEPEEKEKFSEFKEEDRIIIIDTLSEDSFPVRRKDGSEFNDNDFGWLANLFQYLMREAIELDIIFELTSSTEDDDNK